MKLLDIQVIEFNSINNTLKLDKWTWGLPDTYCPTFNVDKNGLNLPIIQFSTCLF